MIFWVGLEFFITKPKPEIGKWIRRGIVLTFLGVIVVSIVIVLMEYMPPLQAVKEWDFEDGTTQGWGVFANDRVSASADVIVSNKVAQDNYSLEILTIDERTDEGNARKN